MLTFKLVSSVGGMTQGSKNAIESILNEVCVLLVHSTHILETSSLFLAMLQNHRPE